MLNVKLFSVHFVFDNSGKSAVTWKKYQVVSTEPVDTNMHNAHAPAYTHTHTQRH